ncbi:tRNA lysidine(34) synthetase TilS, partial [Halomonas sp. BM-2019]|uniref:tRNA lysidine(34) synthetase TilS n=1 Tax=Halomonas sp. BM-2019 TaxID=2811227 RepID=UPI001B3C4650
HQDRNYLRHEVLPRLAARWPRAAESLTRSAALAAEAEGLLGELAELDLARLGGDPARLAVAELGALSRPRRRLLVRHAALQLGLPLPPARRLAELLSQLEARRDAEACVAWPGGEARIWRGELHLLVPLPALPGDWACRWDGTSPLSTHLGVCDLRLAGPPQAAGALVLRPRRGGERLRLAGRGSRDLKRLLQELAVPPWERQRLLVVWQGETAVALLDPVGERWLALAEGWRAQAGESAREKPAAC